MGLPTEAAWYWNVGRRFDLCDTAVGVAVSRGMGDKVHVIFTFLVCGYGISLERM